MSTILKTVNLCKEYIQNKPVIKNINMTVELGEFICIMGASGCGKSTLLNIISTIDTLTSGEIIIDEQNISNASQIDLSEFRKKKLGFIFQDYNLLDTLTLYENISLALIVKNIDKSEIENIVLHVANKIGINQILDKFPYEVSGGQCQRCACARAICSSPKIILADEPTGALDSASSKSFMSMLQTLNREDKATILMVTHDAMSASYCDKILFMKDGEITTTLDNKWESNVDFFHEILKTTERLEV